MKRKALLFFTIIVSVLSFFSFTTQSQGASKKVYVIPLENEVGKGMYKFLNRGLHEAEKAEADLIVIKMDTPGGAVDSAIDIGKRFSNEKIPIVTFVDNEALSAGSYIALNTDGIYMTKSAVMGAAAPITMDGNTAGKKAQSRWNAAMESAANSYGVDSKYALAMADESVNVPEYGAGEDKLLTLTAKNALEVGYSKGTEENLDSLLQKLGYSDASITTVDESVSEKIARFVTNPIVVPILLSIGSLALIIELFTPTFGLAGFVGILSLLLFFFGHMIAGFAGIETIVLFIIGLVLLFLEVFLPGGIIGIIGLGAIFTSFFMATTSYMLMAISIAIAAVVAIGGAFILMKFFKRRLNGFRKLVLSDSTSTEKGYISSRDRKDLIGQQGITTTPLRPSGTVLLNEEYLDVVTEGGYVGSDIKVKIIKVEGSRIVVRPIKEEIEEE